MGLTLCNGYSTRIWTAIMFYSPETCPAAGDPPGGDFEMMGWWGIQPGSCALVYANDLEDLNEFWYFFAQADDGAIWDGPFRHGVPLTAFGGSTACWGLETNSPDLITVGFRELDIGDNDDFTLTFLP